MRRTAAAALTAIVFAGCSGSPENLPAPSPFTGNAAALIDPWAERQGTFGVFVPSPHAMFDANRDRYPTVATAAVAAALGGNELLDFLFLRLDEGNYDLPTVDAIVEGLAELEPAAHPALIVGIQRDTADMMRAQVSELLRHGVDGIVIPYINSAQEAAQAASFFTDAGANVWSPTNPNGRIIAMLMIETAAGLAAAEEIIGTGGYSALGCGVGSLAGELGDVGSAEQACNAIRGLASSTGLPGMMTAFNSDMLALRLEQGYAWILTILNDGTADMLRAGREAADR